MEGKFRIFTNMKEEIKKQRSKITRPTSSGQENTDQKSKIEKRFVPKAASSSKQIKKAIEKNGKTNKTLSGQVVSAKMQDTVVVAIERKVAHPVYRKLIKVTKRIKADTNNMEIKEGDLVVIEQTRPISRDKNFKVVRKEEAK